MIALLLACAAPVTEDPPTPDPLLPAEGAWLVSWDPTYGGDCALDDMDTRQPASVEWRVELESTGFTIYDEYDYPMGCDLTDDVFGCSLGTYDVPYAESGLDATEYISTRFDGAFTTSTSFAAEYSIAAECEGGDCRLVAGGYGDEFRFPCTAVAGLTAVYAD